MTDFSKAEKLLNNTPWKEVAALVVGFVQAGEELGEPTGAVKDFGQRVVELAEEYLESVK